MSVDRWDVEQMIRDAGYGYASRLDLHQAAQDAREGIAQLRAELDDLSAELSHLRGRLDQSRAEPEA